MNTSQQLKMYVVTHKALKYIPKDRTPIFVGSRTNDKGYLTDKSGEEISKKNPYYCELTAIYWIRKNDHSSKYVSIEHYRRFFMKGLMPIKKREMYSIVLNSVVLSKTFVFDDSIYNIYKKHHFVEDLNVAIDIIKKYYPEYVPAMESYLNGNRSHMLNMICCRKDVFDSLCEWLFDILFKVEKIIDYNNRDDYQKRVFGFLSERLMNIRFIKNEFNIKSMNIYYLKSNTLFSQIFSLYKNII